MGNETMPPRIFAALAILLVIAGFLLYWIFDRTPAGIVPQHPGGRLGPVFVNRAAEIGITFRTNYLPNEQGETFKANLYDHGSGLAIGDYNGDGRDDIYFVNQLGPNGLFKNKGDGTFVEVTQEAGVGLGDRICVAATFADYDNDGHQDLFVTSVRGGNLLFHNLGNGKFKDVTKEAGLTHIGHSCAACFFDYDKDGYLDLLITNTAQWTMQFDKVSKYFIGKDNLSQTAASPIEHNILYRNNRNGTFTDVTDKAGMKGKGWGADIAVLDYDGDGFLDVIITHMFGASQLYRNNGNGSFTDVTKATLGRTSWGGMGVKPFSLENNGRLDLYIVDMHSDMWIHPQYDPARVDEKKKYITASGPSAGETDPRFRKTEKEFSDLFQIRYEDVIFGNTCFRALRTGKFEEVSDAFGLENFWPWGIATGDFDCDGSEDVFVPAGMGYPFHYWPNYLLMRDEKGRFKNRAEAAGIEPPPGGKYGPQQIRGLPMARSSRAAATADLDGDGRLEIVVNNFNDQAYCFWNESPKQHYVAFKLRGIKSNRDAIGAVARLSVGSMIMTRQVNPACGYLAQSSKTLHFGLGHEASVHSLEIKWPSGVVQVIDHLEIDRVHEIDEPVRQ